MNRIMLDLETMGNGSNAAIVSIGAVRFDTEKGITGNFLMPVDLESSLEEGGEVTGSTIMWWLKQSQEARDALADTRPEHVCFVLTAFSNWATEHGPVDEIWGCGATADNVWLANAYERSKHSRPWSYKADRCYRTMRERFPDVQADPFIGTAHNALDDATNQALHLIKILKRIESMKGDTHE